MSGRTAGPPERRGSSIELRLVPAARVTGTAGFGWAVRIRDRVLAFSGLGAPVARLLGRLGRGGSVRAVAAGLGRGAGAPLAMAEWEYCVDVLERAGAVEWRLRSRTLSVAVRGSSAGGDPPPTVRFSRFAVIQPGPGGWVIESARTGAVVELAGRASLGLIGALGGRVGAARLARSLVIAPSVARDVIALLWRAGVLDAAAEDRDAALSMWEWPDLLLHRRSRTLDGPRPPGATFGFPKASLPPVVASRPRGRTVPLARPDLRRLRRIDPPFVAVVEARRSARRFGRAPLSLAVIGELLFRAARVTAVRPATASVPYGTSRRPYPSGGGCHPLEVYLVVGRCRGLGAGIHHYDPARHALTMLDGTADGAAALLADAWRDDGSLPAPDLMIVITARFGRTAWKYRGIAYATILKDVGGLLQTLYLTTTAMGLAGTAVGAGDAARFAELIGRAVQEESSVGEFVIGRRARG